ncbi:MAG: DotA/TraY family protein [Pseudomonadota bacterium]
MAETGLGKRILLYTLTPGIAGRFRAFTNGSLTNLSYLIALVFNAVNILPSNHPYLQSQYRKKYGVHHVIIEASKNVNFSFKTLDQVILFFAVIAGLFLFVSQFLILLLMAFTSTAQAGGPFANWFVITAAQEQEDLAYRMLNMVFGVPDLFGNRVEGLLPAFHIALQNMFSLYSQAILVVGVLILLYFITAIVAETAHTGTPFGKRFNHAWAPIRLVVAIGLIIPVASGLNSGQWITLYAAKFGSNFASNGWYEFNRTLTSTYLGDPNILVGVPNAPEMAHLPAFFMMAHACNYAERDKYGRNIDAYVVTASSDTGTNAAPLSSTDYLTALAMSNNSDVYIRFGERDPAYSDQKGFVKPYCGELHLSTSTLDVTRGGFYIQGAYYALMRAWWEGGGVTCPSISGLANADVVADNIQYGHNFMRIYAAVSDRIMEAPVPLYGGPIDQGGLPDAQFKRAAHNNLYSNAQSCIALATAIDRASGVWATDPELYLFGWAGAAIWYNKVAQVNGALAVAAQAVPRPVLYPAMMEYVEQERLQQDDNILARTRYCPDAEDGREIDFSMPGAEDYASTMCIIQRYWEGGGYRSDTQGLTQAGLTNNKMIDAINAILGTSGLFDMCRNTDIHPLAQLAMVGRTMIESAVRNLGFSVASGALGGLAYLFDAHAGAIGMAGSGFFGSVAIIGLLIGFILYYVIPFMPFLYFFFAVGGWIKGLFEAMVGVPLWALAHLRIDGEGLPGDAAADGYFLIFEIFFRPILIVLGLIASILVFSAMVKVLNDIFFIVVSNLTGFEGSGSGFCGITGSTPLERLNSIEYFRGPIDEFFFTIVYAILVYMIGMSCFKLIDNIPNEILRWLNVNVPTFNDKNENDPGGLVQKVTVSGGMIARSMGDGAESLQEAGGSLSRAGGDISNLARGAIQEQQN